MRSASFARRPSTLVNLRDIQQLILECDATLRDDPTCLHTRAIRGHACMKAKLWDRAIHDFSEILRCRPEDIHGRFSRGMAYFKSGQIAAAQRDFSHVLELNSHHVMARYARAGCFNTEGEFQEAIQEYTIALQHDEKENERSGLWRDPTAARAQSMYQHGTTEAATLTSSAGSMRNSESGPVEDRQPVISATTIAPTTDTTSNSTSDSLQPRADQPPAPKRLVERPTANQPHTIQTARKVVQVRVNLSEFAAPAPAPGSKLADASAPSGNATSGIPAPPQHPAAAAVGSKPAAVLLRAVRKVTVML
uniref:Uncharacterized protein n=1 Tax=Globisporangium ultimum (strain ATCC 200006 / CBS 805.95 / DAOM BR144) TaxID=431595 RepID=K3XBG3_GLOUD